MSTWMYLECLDHDPPLQAEGESEGETHVLPLADPIGHEVTDCVCGPTVEPCPSEDGSMGFLVIHYSLDGREASE